MSLADRLRDRIKRQGPITFREWMQAALYDTSEGYYCRHQTRQGRSGDYRTAPEVSPLFAVVFANHFARLFAELGSPRPFTITEIGAGSGEFACGVLNSLRSNHSEVFDATKYVIEEASAVSREQCSARLAELSDRASVRSPIVSEDNPTSEALSDGRAADRITGIVFSNELIDAFPVHRVIGRAHKLKELCVDLGGRDEFVWIETEPSVQVARYCDRINLQLTEGQIFEVSLGAEDFVERAAALTDHGFVVTVDYGAARNDLLNDPNRFSGTLRTFRGHRLSDDGLSNPGEQDLTTTIDWTQMIEAGERRGLLTLALQPLDQFLLAEGALETLQAAGSAISDQAELFNLNAGARELIMPNGMAASFQVLVQRKQS